LTIRVSDTGGFTSVIYIDKLVEVIRHNRLQYQQVTASIASQITMATSTTVGSMLQMAFGSAEEGSVDLDSLHTLLFTIVKK